MTWVQPLDKKDKLAMPMDLDDPTTQKVPNPEKMCTDPFHNPLGP